MGLLSFFRRKKAEQGQIIYEVKEETIMPAMEINNSGFVMERVEYVKGRKVEIGRGESNGSNNR